MVEREMDDAVGVGGRHGDPVEVIKVTPVRRRSERGHGRRGRVRSGETDDIVSGSAEFGNDGRAEMAGRTGDKDAHGDSLSAVSWWPSQ